MNTSSTPKRDHSRHAAADRPPVCSRHAERACCFGLLQATVLGLLAAGNLVMAATPSPPAGACSAGNNGSAAACPAGNCNDCAPWEPGSYGEYANRARAAHVPIYRLRVDDVLRCVYRVTRNETTRPYELNIGDEIQVESFTDANISKSLIIQPDGSISLRLLGQVKASHHTVAQLRDELEQAYTKYYKVPAITVTPIRVNTKLEDLRATIDSRGAAGGGGQGLDVRVSPDGTISLPAIGPLPVQGLTLDELKREIDARYAAQIEGIEVTPILTTRAPRFVYVLGEVKLPGRFTLEGPTTVMQAITLAGSWNVGANLNQVVIFRRGDDWQLLATMVDVSDALHGKCTCPGGEIWLGDSDVVLLPKSAILRTDDFINLVFTRGIYGAFPFSTSYSIGSASSITHTP